MTAFGSLAGPGVDIGSGLTRPRLTELCADQNRLVADCRVPRRRAAILGCEAALEPLRVTIWPRNPWRVWESRIPISFSILKIRTHEVRFAKCCFTSVSICIYLWLIPVHSSSEKIIYLAIQQLTSFFSATPYALPPHSTQKANARLRNLRRLRPCR
jgi:hypothetical protein